MLYEGKGKEGEKMNTEPRPLDDDVLGFLRQARAALIIEQEEGRNSRALAITLTHIDTAVFWRQHDLQTKTPPVNETPA